VKSGPWSIDNIWGKLDISTPYINLEIPKTIQNFEIKRHSSFSIPLSNQQLLNYRAINYIYCKVPFVCVSHRKDTFALNDMRAPAGLGHADKGVTFLPAHSCQSILNHETPLVPRTDQVVYQPCLFDISPSFLHTGCSPKNQNLGHSFNMSTRY
jgi:hypothetical protein